MADWDIRPEGCNRTFDDMIHVYDTYPTLFTLAIQCGGKLTSLPGRSYVGGNVKWVDLVDTDTFSIDELERMLRSLCFNTDDEMHYWYLKPNSDLDVGLMPLVDDDDVKGILEIVIASHFLEVYIEHGPTTVTQLFPPKQVEGTPETGYSNPPAKCLKFLKGASNAYEDDHMMVETSQKSMSPELSKSQVYLSRIGTSCTKRLCLEDVPVEQFVEDTQEGQQTVEDTQEKNMDAYDADDDESGPDSDFKLDEGEFAEEVDVDLSGFDLVIDNDVEWIGLRETTSFEANDEEELDISEYLQENVLVDHFDSLFVDDEFESRRRAMLQSIQQVNPCSAGLIHTDNFKLGRSYPSKKVVKELVKLHAMESRRDLHIVKNDSQRFRVVCNGIVPSLEFGQSSGTAGQNISKGKEVISGNKKCPWVLHVSRVSEEQEWTTKTYNPNHLCNQARNISVCTASFLSKQIVDQVRANPTVGIRALQNQMSNKYEIGVSMDKVYRAKAAAEKQVKGDYKKQYGMLRDYIEELQATNEGTTVKLDVECEANYASETRQFKRIYVCLGALKKGFKAGLREIIGLDGGFMKGPYPGQVLSAVSLDSNNGTYPLAYAIVEAENYKSWKWFLECLGDDLDLSTNSNFTFISDRQKGIIPAIAQLFPSAEHRFCLRHIHENMRKNWKAGEYKDFIWRCATSTTIPEFDKCMAEVKAYNPLAFEWLKSIPAHHWSRSHFTGRAISDVLLNNMCEVFNSKIKDARDKPIITALEYIREYLMKRITTVQKVIGKSTGPLTPSATCILEANKSQAAKYNCIWNGGDKYQVRGPWDDQHVVDVKVKTCTCRKWEMTGIPCKHLIATLWNMEENGIKVGLIENWVHEAYYISTWKRMYSFTIDPIKGKNEWPKSNCPTTLLPPIHHTQIGRPKKKRRASEFEKEDKKALKGSKGKGKLDVENKKDYKLARKYVTVTCSKCKNKGHNSRTCKGQGAV